MNPFAGSNRKRGAALTIGGLAAALAIGAPAPVVAGGGLAPAQTNSREALPPIEKRRQPPKPGKKQPHGDAPKGEWKFYADGAIDPLGTFHSYRALRRQLLSKSFGVMSGRQWRKFRKKLRREAPGLASLTMPQIAGMALQLRAAREAAP